MSGGDRRLGGDDAGAAAKPSPRGLCSRPSLSGGFGKLWALSPEVEDGDVSDASVEEVPETPASASAGRWSPSLGDYIAAARELGGPLSASRRRSAFAPGGRGSRFGTSPAAARSACRWPGFRRTPSQPPAVSAGAWRVPSRPGSLGGGAPPPSRPCTSEICPEPPPRRPGAVEEDSVETRVSAASWVGSDDGPGLLPFDADDVGPWAASTGQWTPPAAQSGILRLVSLGPAQSSDPGLCPTPAGVFPWLWMPRGALDLSLGFPDTADEVRRRGKQARRVTPIPPPAPLLRSYAAAVMNPNGAGGQGAQRGGGGKRRADGRPAVEEARAEASSRAKTTDGRGKPRAARLAEENKAVAPSGAAAPPPASAPRQKKLPASKPTDAPSSAGGNAPRAECFLCGRSGHFQADCTYEPVCVLCGEEGHNTANCATRGQKPALLLMGQAIAGEGFFYLDFEDEEDDAGGASNDAVVSFNGMGLSAPDLEAELRHLVECAWDWRVRQVADRQFSVVFPTAETLKMCTRSGRLFLPLSNTEASIRLADSDPAPAVELQEVWVQLSGLPRKMRRADRLRVVVELFHGKLGYKVGVRVIPTPPDAAAAQPPPPPPPARRQDPEEDDEDEDLLDSSPSENTWQTLGRHDASRSASAAAGAGQPSSAASGGTQDDAAAPGDATASLAPLARFDEYGSNLQASTPWPLPLATLEKLRSSAMLQAPQESGDPSSMLISTETSTGVDGSPSRDPDVAETGGSLPRPLRLDMAEVQVPRSKRMKTVPEEPPRKSKRL
ncbi:unnamed protein product [Alopecurus aequalis]